MTRLVGIPGEKNSASTAPRSWINPDHIVQLVPIIDTDGRAQRLVVEIKLVGLPLMRCSFGTFDSTDALDQRWQAFLTEIGNAKQDEPQE